MTGLAVGSASNFKSSGSAIITINAIILVIYYLCAGLIFNNIPKTGSYVISLILLLLFIFIPAALTGQLFNVMTSRKEIFSEPGSVYSADLAGSALGFVMVSGVAIPALGIRFTIILLSALIFAALLFGRIMNK
jgi:hypothetical protein